MSRFGDILRDMSYINCDIQHIKRWLRANLSEEKYRHSLGAMYCAKDIAHRVGADEEKAELAALLHDCAKCLPLDEQQRIAQSYEGEVADGELANGKLVHSLVSARVANCEFGVNDEEILSSIRWHTLGKINMTDLEKVVFIADKIEIETRKPRFRQKVLLALDTDGLNGAMAACFKLTIRHLLKRKVPISHRTIDIYNSLISV